MSNKYEMVCVFHPRTAEDKIEASISKLEKKVSSTGGTFDKVNKIGLRKVNTRMRDFNGIRDGYYVEVVFSSAPSIPAELTASLRVNEDVMRFIITKAPQEPKPVEKAAEESVEVNPEMLIGKPE